MSMYTPEQLSSVAEFYAIQDASGRTSSEFLTELFEFEYCAECGGDVGDHTARLVLGNWFAWCESTVTIVLTEREQNLLLAQADNDHPSWANIARKIEAAQAD